MWFEILTTIMICLLSPIILTVLFMLSLRVCDGPIIQEAEWCWLTVMIGVPAVIIFVAIVISCCCVCKNPKKVLVKVAK